MVRTAVLQAGSAAVFALLAVLHLQIVASESEVPTAECKVVILGYEDTGSSSSKHGISFASLNCSTSDGPLPVLIDEKHLARFKASFSGVSVVSRSKCKQLAEASNMLYRYPIRALLYFCSSHQLTLLQPLVQGVALVDANSNNHPDDPALLLFGGSISASMIGGVFVNNTLGAALVVQQQASLQITDTSVTGHMGTRGLAVYASGESALVISNSSFSNMNTAGAVQGGGQASITIHSSTFGSNTMNKWDDIPAGILTFYDNSTASVSWSNFRRNTARFDVAIALYGSAQVRLRACLDGGLCSFLKDR